MVVLMGYGLSQSSDYTIDRVSYIYYPLVCGKHHVFVRRPLVPLPLNMNLAQSDSKAIILVFVRLLALLSCIDEGGPPVGTLATL